MNNYIKSTNDVKGGSVHLWPGEMKEYKVTLLVKYKDPSNNKQTLYARVPYQAPDEWHARRQALRDIGENTLADKLEVKYYDAKVISVREVI